MERLFLTLFLLAGILTGIQAQQTGAISGDFTFKSVTISAEDNKTGAPVFSKTITDPEQLLTEELPFPAPLVVFATVEVANGQVVSCTLLNNDKEYLVEDNRLVRVNPDEENGSDQPVDEYEEADIRQITVRQAGNDIAVTVGSYVYGSSSYPNHVLRGKYVLIMSRVI